MKVLASLIFSMMLISQAQAATFKIATITPDGNSWMVAMRKAGKDIEKATEGRVKFKFYPGGVMGSDAVAMRKIRLGQLQGAAVTSGNISKFNPDVDIYSMPLKLRGYDEVDYLRERMDADILEKVETNGMVSFGLAEGGFAYIFSKQPIASLADLKGKKIWIPQGDEAVLQAVQAFDISPIPLVLSDVLAGLQTGLIDTVATSPIGAIALQWHTQVKYMTDLPLLYLHASLVIDKKRFNRISKEDQATVRRIMGGTYVDIDKQNRIDNVSAYEALKKLGIEFVSPNEEQLAEWYDKARASEAGIVEKGFVTQEGYKTLEQHLSTLRDQPE